MATPSTTSISHFYQARSFWNENSGAVETIEFGVAPNSTTTEVILSTLTHSLDKATAWIEDEDFFRQPYVIEDLPEDALIIGLDVKMSQEDDIALVTLAVGPRCLVYQVAHNAPIPLSLYEFFEDQDERVLFVGVNVPAMVDRLKAAFGDELEVSRWKNLGELAEDRSGRNDMANMGLNGLAEQILGINMIPPAMETMPEAWDASVLEPERVMHAIRDAFMCFQLGQLLKAWEE